MNNYVYIIAGLPELAMNFDGAAFAYAEVRDNIVGLLSEKDQQLVALLEEGFDDTTLSADFYKKVKESKNGFVRDYFDFDLSLRNMKVAYLAKRLNQDGGKFVVDLSDPDAIEPEMPQDFEDEKRVQAILDNPDFVQREQLMDQLKWDKASELATFEYFSMNAILAFLVKAKMVQRWAELDKERGEQLFQQLVGEVRGTFKGVEYDEKK
ncbi:MAG: DUF2764 family protein [Bacteroidales bacterium]|nr:DUF2764 family protein [Bacteroidales bacterium]